MVDGSIEVSVGLDSMISCAPDQAGASPRRLVRGMLNQCLQPSSVTHFVKEPSGPVNKLAIILQKRRKSREVSVEFPARAAKLRPRAPPRRASGKSLAEETGMAMQLGHVHIKTREDPQKVAKFYIDNFGATVKRETPGRGCQLDLHGVQLNVTTINADQNHEQHVGIEHIAIETDDYPGARANLKKNGAQILEERFNNGRHVCWVAAPDGAQMELIEKV